MSFPAKAKDRPFFLEVYSQANEFLGAVYLNSAARKWAIKEYPGQWFETQEKACTWLMARNQPVVRG
jgi:hypothetical protein